MTAAGTPIDGSTLSGVLILPMYPPSPGDFATFSHLGGLPSLPDDVEWPRNPDGVSLHFLGQVDLAAIPESGIVDYFGGPVVEFPRSGALYFFADCATFGLWERPDDSHRVLYVPHVKNTALRQAPSDLPAHNSPVAPVMCSTHHLYNPRLTARPLSLLPHVPLSFRPIESIQSLPSGKTPSPRYLYEHGTGYEWGGDLSRATILEQGFPWRWLLLERLVVSIHTKATENRTWSRSVQESCENWLREAALHDPIAALPKPVLDRFLRWFRALASEKEMRNDISSATQDAMISAWPYIGFSGDLSDIPPYLVSALRPIDRPTMDSHHKMFGNAMSVQLEQLADEANILLLRLESDYVLDYCWGDVGVLQITIRREDLADGDFSKTSLNADCG